MKKTSNKYKDFEYTDSVLDLLEVELSSADRKRLDKIYSNYEKLEKIRAQEPDRQILLRIFIYFLTKENYLLVKLLKYTV